ncbi:hypothetical protein [Butyrivibrio sp. INlla14]|nr:hypothetical protein [Butyrivibrio sp. INlla14]SCY42700.1 hypothetical protein SAMN02910371_02244 [Butyrivibrio sp. INlla14]
MGEIDILLTEEMQDREFVKAWKETEQEYDMKRRQIADKIEKSKVNS